MQGGAARVPMAAALARSRDNPDSIAVGTDPRGPRARLFILNQFEPTRSLAQFQPAATLPPQAHRSQGAMDNEPPVNVEDEGDAEDVAEWSDKQKAAYFKASIAPYFKGVSGNALTVPTPGHTNPPPPAPVTHPPRTPAHAGTAGCHGTRDHQRGRPRPPRISWWPPELLKGQDGGQARAVTPRTPVVPAGR